MYRNVLENIEGIEAFPVIALSLFVSFFVLMLIRLWKMDRNHIREMEEMPLDDEQYENNGGRTHG